VWAVPHSEFVHWQWYSKAVALSSAGLEEVGGVRAPVCVRAGGNDTQNGLVQLVTVPKQTHRPVLFCSSL